MGKITSKFPEKYYGFLFHYYRAEVYRETSWRNRLDVTTNWAIIITAAMLSFVFGTPGISHAVVIINYVIVWFFLYIEAHRLRYYALVRSRVKIFEKHILGNMFSLDEEGEDSDDWLTELGDKLINPKIKMSRIESLSWRLRRSYIFILLMMFFVWLYKVSVFPEPMVSFLDLLNNAKVGIIPGILVFAFMIISLLVAMYIAMYVSRKHVEGDLP